MFSGLSNFIKYVLPKRLFYRALIIVAAPTIILQIIITIVFYDSIWIKVNKNMTRSLVSQLKTIEEVYQNDKKNLDFFTDSYKNNFNFEIDINDNPFPAFSGERKYSPIRLVYEVCDDLNNEDLMLLDDKTLKQVIDSVKKGLKNE